MGKKCAVPGCRSGSSADIKQRKLSGVRQASLFKVPKKEDARIKWSQALAITLKLDHVICEHHFNDRDVQKEDITVMKDRTIVAIPRDHYALRPDVVPNLTPENCKDTAIEEPVPMEIETSNGHTNQLMPDTGLVVPDASHVNIEPNISAIDPSTELPTTSVRNEHQPKEFVQFEMLLDDTDTEDGSDGNVLESGEQSERVVPAANVFHIQDLTRWLEVTPLPKMWTWNNEPSDQLNLLRVDAKTYKPVLQVKVNTDMSVTSSAPDGGRTLDLAIKIGTEDDLSQLIEQLKTKQLCTGTSMEEKSRARQCTGILSPDDYVINRRDQRCLHCRHVRRRLQQKRNRPKVDYQAKYTRVRHELDLERRKNRRLKKKTEKFKRLIQRQKQQCANVEENALMSAIAELPEVQQEAVKACFSAAKVVNTKRRRYTLEWVYECLLMRIKNGKLYEHVRTHNILPVPCQDTISRYIRRMDSAYGFQTAVFDCLKLKTSRMEVAEKRGSLLIDEMSLSEAISLDTKTMKFKGFVDLGHFTPDHQLNVRADHALVFMFQPFRGAWVQVLGSFLSKNSVTSQILHKMVIEVLLLLSEAGFHVDVVTMDGAQWNRGVWSLFGISDQNFSCEHPCDPSRRLWMVSDFPHLIKCFRNGLVKLESFWTPYGTVMKNHWRTLLDREGYMKCNLKVAYNLTPVHLDPKGYQTMNVRLAFELFSDQVIAAMRLFQDDPTCPQLKSVDPTIKLCDITNNLIKAMMSRTPGDALRPNDGCAQKKAIQEFDRFLREWAATAKAQKQPFPISSSTLSGLKVTLGSTLELLQFLHDDCNYEYLMTSRLNQDALERFFGMMRSACGSNDHPDPTLFAQVFRLLASYSLVKPPKGGNVCGTELLGTLMQARESIGSVGPTKEDWLKQLDVIIENGCKENVPDDDNSSTVIANEHDYDSSQSSNHDHMTSHDYDVVTTSVEVQAYVAGYVARKIQRFTRCEYCIQSVQTEDRSDRDRLIDLMNRYGGLTYPSDQLLDLTQKMEAVVLDVVGKLTVKMNTLHQILERVRNISILPYVGCENHHKELTRKVINFYIVTRGHFLSKGFNENHNAKKLKSKANRKNSKL